MKILLLCAAVISLMAFAIDDLKILGKWRTKHPGGTMDVEFKQDSTYKAYLNDKMMVYGKYTFKDSVYTFKDGSPVDGGFGPCEVDGHYKLSFLADSAIRFNVINDDCGGRKMGMDGIVFVKVKSDSLKQ